MTREYKSFDLPIGATKVLDDNLGIVEHIITVFGVLDKGNDISHPGSFVKTLAERGNRALVLDQHRTDSVMRVLGKPMEIREIGRAELPPEILRDNPEATGGVKAVTQFFLDTPEGAGAFTRIKQGGLREWSYGYDALDKDYAEVDWRGSKVTARNLRTVKLYEYSPVLWGMAESATLGAKADEAPAEAPAPEPPATKTVAEAVADLMTALQAAGIELPTQLTGGNPDATTGAAAHVGTSDASTANDAGQEAPETDQPANSASDTQAGPDTAAPDGAADVPPTSEQDRLLALAEAVRIRANILEVEDADL
jgi:hypothetical protein